MRLKTRTELLLIAAGWSCTYAAACWNNPRSAMPAIYATLLGTGVSLAAHRKVMKFFEISLDEDGPRTQRIYHAAITALIVGLVGSAVAFWLGAATGEQGF